MDHLVIKSHIPKDRRHLSKPNTAVLFAPSAFNRCVTIKVQLASLLLECLYPTIKGTYNYTLGSVYTLYTGFCPDGRSGGRKKSRIGPQLTVSESAYIT